MPLRGRELPQDATPDGPPHHVPATLELLEEDLRVVVRGSQDGGDLTGRAPVVPPEHGADGGPPRAPPNAGTPVPPCRAHSSRSVRNAAAARPSSREPSNALTSSPVSRATSTCTDRRWIPRPSRVHASRTDRRYRQPSSRPWSSAAFAPMHAGHVGSKSSTD